jgi:4-amino-4-deoxy-L-arabinose transferase-like glycosyltransferase
MEFQQEAFEANAVPDGLSNHARRLARRVFVSYATPAGPLPFSPDVVLVGAGLVVLGALAGRELRRRQAGAALLFQCWVLAFYAVITASLGFDSPHYYAPLVAANVICSGVAIGTAAQSAQRAMDRFNRAGRASAQKTQMPAA